jgi:hypothetical protein
MLTLGFLVQKKLRPVSALMPLFHHPWGVGEGIIRAVRSCAVAFSNIYLLQSVDCGPFFDLHNKLPSQMSINIKDKWFLHSTNVTLNWEVDPNNNMHRNSGLSAWCALSKS